jgi:MerR family transcriptional regulator, repressor of the yfmOP operon
VTTTSAKPLRIGEVAELTGTTPRTIRYYEEIGLLPGPDDRAQGKHRSYSEADVDRVREIIRLRDLLGLSLEELSKLLEAETARAEIRRKYRETEDPEIQRRLLNESLGYIAGQLELVRRRKRELDELERELVEKRRSVNGKLAALKR